MSSKIVVTTLPAKPRHKILGAMMLVDCTERATSSGDAIRRPSVLVSATEAGVLLDGHGDGCPIQGRTSVSLDFAVALRDCLDAAIGKISA